LIAHPTDALSNRSYTSYDGLNRVTKITDAIGGVIQFTYDAADRLTSISQAAGPTNNNTVQTITYTYDAGNRLTQTKLANGITITAAYDLASQLSSLTYKQGSGPIAGTVIGDLSYTYDAGGK
jgi:YD repeat-containing protein